MMTKREIFADSGLNLIDEINQIKNIKQDAKVLDVGCGDGYSVNCLCKKGFDATGVDYCEEVIDFGKKNYTKINIKVMDANNLEFPSDYFDLILFECSLSIMKDHKKILNDCKRFLKKYGVILLNDFFIQKPDEDSEVYSLSYWNELFESLDFKIIKFIDKSKEWRNYLGMMLWE